MLTGIAKMRNESRVSGAVFKQQTAFTIGTTALVALAIGCGEGSATKMYEPPKSLSDAGPDAAARADAAGTGRDGPIEPDDIPGLSVLLKDGRLTGWIHGAVHERGVYVFTYRKPQDFFSFAQFPLTPATANVLTQLQSIKRHDAVTIKGTFVENIAPIKHIRLESLSVTTPFVRDENPPPRTPETAFPDELIGQTEAIAKVHAVDTDGRILVIEYGDAVVPVFVRVPSLTAGLYRNDKIRLAFEFAVVPARPTHLWLDTAHAKPIEVVERLLDQHGKPIEAEGALVRFQKSPEISIDVYAMQVTDSENVTREYTLLNDQDQVIFTAILDKLAAAWKARPGQGLDGRNKLINPLIRVHARGTFNLIAPNQANAQILLDSADDLTVTLLP